ncbi:unnamed protein product [Owenia fusiformis]|uniref:MARVEL domain-containing protein n=1 Tax=Owenia fusiformis TaxID=6347 RepID=A0A8S4NUB3_OWEFU|nr:unnamed protein product [Owenia fusiformis]
MDKAAQRSLLHAGTDLDLEDHSSYNNRLDDDGHLATGLNTYAIKEPRGFIKLIQVIIAIFAFATTTSFSGHSTFSFLCGATKKDKHLDFSYPFRLSATPIKVEQCDPTLNNGTINGTEMFTPYGNMASSAEFYVFVGVMAFLYSLGALVLYVVFDHIYRKYDLIPIADFIVSALFAVLWLISSSAWAQGVTDLKYYTSPKGLFFEIPQCPPNAFHKSYKFTSCKGGNEANFATLNVSLIFGFLNCGVWVGNLWFLWKETLWFKLRSKPTTEDTPEIAQQQEPQRV